MKIKNGNISFKKGLTAKSIIITVSIITVLSLITGATYMFWNSFFFYPEFLDSLNDTLKAKNTSLTEFSFEKFSKEGTNEIDVAIPDKELEGKLTIERKNRSTLATLQTEGETINLIQKYYVVGLYDETFDNGEIYGSTILGLEEKINNSIFSPTSGSKYALSQEFVDQLCVWADLLVGQQEHSEKKLIMEKVISDAIKESDIADTYEKGTKEVSVNGETRKCKVQSFTLTKENVSRFIEQLGDTVKNLDDEELEALEYYAKMGETINVINKDQQKEQSSREAVANLLDSYALRLKEREDIEFTFDIQICYTGKYISAIVIDYDYANENPSNGTNILGFDTIELPNGGPTDAKGVITLDFGKAPQKTRDILYTNKGDGTVNGVAFSGSEYTLTSEKSGNDIIYSLKGNSNKEESNIIFTMNDSTGKAILEITKGDNKKTQVDFTFSDSKEILVLELQSVTINNTKLDFPYKIKLTFKDSSNVIRLGDYNRLFINIEDQAAKENTSKNEIINREEEKYDALSENFDAKKKKWEQIFEDWKTGFSDSRKKIMSQTITNGVDLNSN